MAVRLRLKKMGRKKQPYYRIGAFESTSPRDGRAIEELGYYHPLVQDEEKQLVLNKERVEHWLQHGAKPTETVASLLKKRGISVKA
ncbi:MAG: 30S ribosomal protein S16 [Planctomycetes bacterium]|nr:30S ribosomal protein S16 [Planctomycetota bacterium]